MLAKVSVDPKRPGASLLLDVLQEFAMSHNCRVLKSGRKEEAGAPSVQFTLPFPTRWLALKPVREVRSTEFRELQKARADLFDENKKTIDALMADLMRRFAEFQRKLLTGGWPVSIITCDVSIGVAFKAPRSVGRHPYCPMADRRTMVLHVPVAD